MGVTAFRSPLIAHGLWDRVRVMTYSEFAGGWRRMGVMGAITGPLRHSLYWAAVSKGRCMGHIHPSAISLGGRPASHDSATASSVIGGVFRIPSSRYRDMLHWIASGSGRFNEHSFASIQCAANVASHLIVHDDRALTAVGARRLFCHGDIPCAFSRLDLSVFGSRHRIIAIVAIGRRFRHGSSWIVIVNERHRTIRI